MYFSCMRFPSSILVLLMSFIQLYCFAQKGWDKETLEKANTAKDIGYLTEEEKQVIFYTNLLRLDPLLFRNTFVKHYIDSTGSKSKYAKSLLKTLETQPSLPVLKPSERLYKIAKEHAITFGKQGKTGHGNLKKRFQSYLNDCKCAIAENCYYGNVSALDMVIGLLIDENVSNLGHRKNLLNAAFTNTGVCISPHKTYKRSCVADYSSAVKD